MVPFKRDLRKSDISKVNGLVEKDHTVSWTRNTRTEDNNIAVVKHLWIEAGQVITVSYLFHRVSPSLARFTPGIPHCVSVLKRVATVEAFPNFKDEKNFHDSVIPFPIKFNYFSRIIFQKSKFYKLRTRVLSNYPFLGIVIFNFKSSIQRFTIPLSQILNFWKTMTFTFIYKDNFQRFACPFSTKSIIFEENNFSKNGKRFFSLSKAISNNEKKKLAFVLPNSTLGIHPFLSKLESN